MNIISLIFFVVIILVVVKIFVFNEPDKGKIIDVSEDSKVKKIIKGLIPIAMLVLELLPNSNASLHVTEICDDLELDINCRLVDQIEYTSFFDIENWNRFWDLIPLTIGVLTCACLIMTIYGFFKPNKKIERFVYCFYFIIFIIFLIRICAFQSFQTVTWIGYVIMTLTFLSSIVYIINRKRNTIVNNR